MVPNSALAEMEAVLLISSACASSRLWREPKENPISARKRVSTSAIGNCDGSTAKSNVDFQLDLSRCWGTLALFVFRYPRAQQFRSIDKRAIVSRLRFRLQDRFRWYQSRLRNPGRADQSGYASPCLFSGRTAASGAEVGTATLKQVPVLPVVTLTTSTLPPR